MFAISLSLLFLILLSPSSYASPLDRRAPPTLKVVTNPTGSLDACTPAQVNTLRAALAEGASLATKAATELSQARANTSDAATKWLGTSQCTNLLMAVMMLTCCFSHHGKSCDSGHQEVDESCYSFQVDTHASRQLWH